ncbi:hypothetical protein FHR53_002789 [Xanthomonas arboricola]
MTTQLPMAAFQTSANARFILIPPDSRAKKLRAHAHAPPKTSELTIEMVRA